MTWQLNFSNISNASARYRFFYYVIIQQGETVMKKILLSVMVFALVSGCSSAKKNETPVSNEATASGGNEKVESSAMDFSAKGSDSGTIEGLQTVRFEYDKA